MNNIGLVYAKCQDYPGAYEWCALTCINWVAAREPKFGYQNKGDILFPMSPYSGTCVQVPWPQPSKCFVLSLSPAERYEKAHRQDPKDAWSPDARKPDAQSVRMLKFGFHNHVERLSFAVSPDIILTWFEFRNSNPAVFQSLLQRSRPCSRWHGWSGRDSTAARFANF